MIFSPTYSGIPNSELTALLDLADTTSVGWDTSITAGACDWVGVTCRDDTVVGLHLCCRGLTGHLPESIGNLTHLERFSVGENALSGQLPASMGNLGSLTELNLGGNQFTGPISIVSSLTSLFYLYLSKNQFTDSLDFLSGLSSLTHIYLAHNDFYGLILPAVTKMCASETTTCVLTDNNRLCGDGERGENIRSSFLTNQQLPLLTLLHSPLFTQSSQYSATPALHVPLKPTALPTASATTASTPQTFSVRHAHAIILTPEAVA